LSVDESLPISVSMRAGEWQKVLWAIGKQPIEMMLPQYNQIQAQMVQAVIQARQAPADEAELVSEKGN